MRDDGITLTLRIEVQCSRAGLRSSSNLDLSRFVPLRMKRRGVETRIVIAAGDDLPRKVDPALLKAVARSRGWFEELASGSVRSLAVDKGGNAPACGYQESQMGRKVWRF